MDTELVTIFLSAVAELNDIESCCPMIDLTDSRLLSDRISPDIASPSLRVSSPSWDGFGEIEFMLANNFWGCSFDFGNSACGVQIRQGIAHMIDRAKFAANEPSLAGGAVAVDNPEPGNSQLPSPNPCAWDSRFNESGSTCVVGAPGGTAYILGSALGANGISWLQAPGSADLNAAAQHFVNAGVATGFNSATSVLTGINPNAATHFPTFFIRNDNSALLHLGDSLAEEICYVFTGSYNIPCPFLNITHGPITAFPGFTTSTTSVNLSWWIYTSGAGSWPLAGFPASKPSFVPNAPFLPDPFDSSLYFTFNSRFVSGITSIRTLCSKDSGPTAISADYMYVCQPGYDSLSSKMEFAPCLKSSTNDVDSQIGLASPTYRDCSGNAVPPSTSPLTALSAGLQAEDTFGQGAFTIPIYSTSNQYVYLNNWSRIMNRPDGGIPNFFTTLNAHNPSPSQLGTIRQGLSQTTGSLSPYAAATFYDFMILGNIYDSLGVPDPLSPGNLMNWMAESEQAMANSGLLYTPPAGTTITFRFTLRNDLFFQDGRKLTAFDVAFSYLSLKATEVAMGSGAASMTGVTILGPTQFDINIGAVGPFTLLYLTGLPILPGRYWTGGGRLAYDSSVNTCTATGAACFPAQYTLDSTATIPGSGSPGIPATDCALTGCANFAASLMNVNPPQTSATYDPLQNNVLVGSGAWTCGTVTSSGSGACSSSGAMNPPVGGSYSLTRFGKGQAPASSVSSIYFRSPGNLALYLWSQDNGDTIHDFLNFSVVLACFGKAPLPIGSTDPCAHFQEGIGSGGGPVSVGLQQVVIVNRFLALNWISPFKWASSPPVGIGTLPPVLYENTITLNPASVIGCNPPYPVGGYDC